MMLSVSVRALLRLSLVLLAAACVHLPWEAAATEAGWRQYTVPASASAPDAIPVALYYPTEAPARTIAMGPFTLRVAIGAPADAQTKGLIVVSHGTGGSELGHSSLAEALARSGYLVAALRHPGDNYADRSLREKPPGAYFIERPRQASRVIDALLGDPDWKDRVAGDARGPRIGALGHSAGGYTVIALAGGQVDLSRIVSHCERECADDPIFCNIKRPQQALPEIPPLIDARVRAVVAMAPLGVAFTAPSLAAIRIPTLIYAAERDRWLVPRFHAAWIAQNVPHAEFHVIENAWHFAFMDRPNVPVPTPDVASEIGRGTNHASTWTWNGERPK
ncbi:MAG: dienelactone hydrolase [Methylobacteriaceae bacterium]|nr:dienelactone hydrolase [Methylobacteriaceae bacterium]